MIRTDLRQWIRKVLHSCSTCTGSFSRFVKSNRGRIPLGMLQGRVPILSGHHELAIVPIKGCLKLITCLLRLLLYETDTSCLVCSPCCYSADRLRIDLALSSFHPFEVHAVLISCIFRPHLLFEQNVRTAAVYMLAIMNRTYGRFGYKPICTFKQ